MSRRSLLALGLAAVVLASVATPVAADPSLSITGVSVPDSVTQGDSFDLTVSVSGDELQNDEADVSLTLPDGLSCSPSGVQTVTLSGGTGSATFDCTADLEGDYTGEITVSAQATDTNDGSTLSDSTQSGLAVISPATLTLSTAIENDTVDAGSATTLTVVVQNAGDASTSYQLSQSSAGGYSTSVASGSASGTIAGDETRVVEYSVAGDSGGDYTLTTTLTGGNGQEVRENESLSVEAPSGGGGGGGGGGGAAGDDLVDVTPPTAVASASTTDVTVGSTVTLDASGSSDDEGIERYEWDVDGDGGYEKNGSVVTHSYDSPGDRTVTLRVADGRNEATDTVTISVRAQTTETPTVIEETPQTATDSTPETTTGSSGPGFTVAAALLAVVAAAFLARRR